MEDVERYGQEFILDLHNCDEAKFNRTDIELYFIELCDLINMKRCALHFWDDENVAEEDKQTKPHLKGISAIQFILTSNITIHTLDILKKVYINVFSCKDFDEGDVQEYSKKYFKGVVVRSIKIDRV